jgi:hypothetical protein
MAGNRIFIVVKNDTVIQSTGYIVRAHDQDDATALVNAGMYIEETSSEVLDTIDSETVIVEEITTNAEGQKRK